MVDYTNKRKNKLKNEVKAYALLGFPMGWWTLFFVVAFFSALFFSFTNVSLKKLATGAEIKFTLDNYKRIFCPDFAKFDGDLWDSMGVTVVWTVVMTLGNNLMGLVCAFLINSLKKGKRFFLALLFWPSLVSGVVGSDVTKMVFGSDNNSLANKIVMFFGGQPITAKEFDALTAVRMENTGKVRGVFDVNFDKREFSAVHIMDGWRTWAMRDVSPSVYHATRSRFASADEQLSKLLELLDGKEITSAGHLSARNFSFGDEIMMEEDGKLNFYVDADFDVDAVFGTFVCTDKNDDWLNIYANYDIAEDRPCDTLELTLCKGDGSEESWSYPLNAAEKDVLLRKMEEEGVTVPEQADLTVLSAEEELALVKQISLLPEEIIGAAADRDPSRLNKYAVALCAQFHRFYNACRIKEAEDEVRDARLVLCRAARQTIYNVLTMIGVEAPEHM